MKTIFMIYHLFIASKLKCIQHSTWNATKLGRIYQLNKKTYRTKKTSDITLQIKRLHTIQRQKEGHQPDNFSFLFLQIPYKIIKSITARQQKLTLHLLLRLRNSINSHIRNQYYYFFNRILINTLLPSSSILSACFRILGSSEVSQASNNS